MEFAFGSNAKHEIPIFRGYTLCSKKFQGRISMAEYFQENFH